MNNGVRTMARHKRLLVVGGERKFLEPFSSKLEPYGVKCEWHTGESSNSNAHKANITIPAGCDGVLLWADVINHGTAHAAREAAEAAGLPFLAGSKMFAHTLDTLKRAHFLPDQTDMTKFTPEEQQTLTLDWIRTRIAQDGKAPNHRDYKKFNRTRFDKGVASAADISKLNRLAVGLNPESSGLRLSRKIAEQLGTTLSYLERAAAAGDFKAYPTGKGSSRMWFTTPEEFYAWTATKQDEWDTAKSAIDDTPEPLKDEAPAKVADQPRDSVETKVAEQPRDSVEAVFELTTEAMAKVTALQHEVQALAKEASSMRQEIAVLKALESLVDRVAALESQPAVAPGSTVDILAMISALSAQGYKVVIRPKREY